MRSARVAATLTHSAALAFPRVGLLFTDHVDVLCEVLPDKVFALEDGTIETSEEQNDPAPASALVKAESDERLLKRKRDNGGLVTHHIGSVYRSGD